VRAPAEMTGSALEAALFAAVGTKQGHRRHDGLRSAASSSASTSPWQCWGSKDPVLGVIGIQSGPPGRRVHSGFPRGHGRLTG
jgi:hypothetical protein